MKGVNDERLQNGVVQVFIPPFIVGLGGGTTLPGRCTGKNYKYLWNSIDSKKS